MARDAQIQIRRDTAANWTSVNPTLAAGEFGFETDTGMVKIGDGTTAWVSVQYTSSKMVDWATGQDSAAYDIFPRYSTNSAVTYSNGNLRVGVFTATRTLTVSNITGYCSTAGTDTGGTTYRRMGIYTISGNTITLVARTANTTSLFTATGANTAALSATGGYVSTYTIKAGTRYAVGAYMRNDSGTFGAPTLQAITSLSSILAASPRLNGLTTISSGDLPTADQTVGDSGLAPFFRLT